MTRRLGERGSIVLRSEDHTYVLSDGTELGPSVSTVAASPWPAFDPVTCARRCGPAARLKWTGDRDGSDEAIIAAWASNAEAAANRGTEIHAAIEAMLLSLNHAHGATPRPTDAPISPGDGPSLCPVVAAWIVDRYPTSDWELHPELIVYGSVYDGGPLIPGTIDLAAVRRDTDEVTLVDWKTGSVDDSKGNRDAVFGIKGTRLAKYSIQLGLYKLILERWYGVSVRALEVVQITPGETPTVYPAKPEMADDVCASIAAMFDG